MKKTSPTPPPSPGRSGPVHPSGKTYATNGYDSAAAQAQRREQSRVTYQAGSATKPTYRTPGGVDKPVVSTAPEVQRVRKVVTPEVWRTRPVRIGTVYRPYFGYPAVVYNDPYNAFFWYWLLSQSLDSQAYWTYHHRYSMDQRRYDDLLRQNAQLSARVQQLEKAGAPRDASYVPSGIDPDLMYADDYVDAVYNPQVVQSDLPDSYDFPTDAPRSDGMSVREIWTAIWHGMFAMAATFAICFFLIWLIFVKRWGGDRPPRTAKAHGRRLRR